MTTTEKRLPLPSKMELLMQELCEHWGHESQNVSEETPDSEKYSEQESLRLIAAFLERIGQTLEQSAYAYLASLVQTLKRTDGSPATILSENHDTLLAMINDLAPSSFPAIVATHILKMARGIEENPVLRPWLDLNDFFSVFRALRETASSSLTDSEKAHLSFLEAVAKTGMLRSGASTPNPLSILGLTTRFPNFREPLRFLAEQAAFGTLQKNARMHLVPILLAGPAGVGKTYFASALAKLLNTRIEQLNMSSQSCGFAISGLDRGWSSARSGLVFDALRHGQSMSPMIVLDEIDKANDESRSAPLGPLYNLLEPRSSCAFKDEYAGFAIDASQIFWIATANDTSRIPGPLLDRFRVFEIAAPTVEEVTFIAEQLLIETGAGTPGAPTAMPDAWKTRLAGHSLRSVGIGIRQALGRAALRAVQSEEAALTLVDNDLVLGAPEHGRRIGF